MAYFPNLLTPLQRQILDVARDHLPGFFLTGGTALGVFYLGHRRSVDVDLFSRDKATYEDRVRDFVRLMTDRGLKVTAGSAGVGFRRFTVQSASESLPVDLVLDTTPAVAPPAHSDDGLALDSIEDITANKLCAILGRAEVRDYVDLYFLARAGHDPLASLAAAQRKDGGLDAASLAFVLSDVRVNASPEGLEKAVSADELRAFIDDLRRRLATNAFPKPAE